MLENYLPILIFLAIGVAIGVGPIVLGYLLATQKPDSEKNSPFGFIAMMIFLGILVVGFIYEWQKGALEWE